CSLPHVAAAYAASAQGGAARGRRAAKSAKTPFTLVTIWLMSLRIGRFLPGGKSPWHEDFSPVYDRAAAARGIAAPMFTKSRLTVPKRNTSGVREAFTSRPANADFGPCGTRSLLRCLTSKQ